MLIAFGGALLTVPLAFSHSLGFLVLGGFCLQFMVQGAWGIIPRTSASYRQTRCADSCPGVCLSVRRADRGKCRLL